ncbi:MAG: winged helix DNA-binding domain-containing protein [Actinomycetota bacterium]|nr:winged helix DNA-binding domain-containing protein [Actinomycetota bacterium]MDQ6946915.1 winged helix DNA-binding domain-containing protein [Actinomycetota bacterium]
MSWPQALAWRLGRQLLTEPRGSVVEAARRVAGVQAQVMSSAELAVGVRTALTPASVRNALWTDRTLVKTWAMRGTLHLLPADELPIWVAALRAKEQSARRGAAWERYHGITVAQLELTTAAIGQVLGVTPMTRQELGAAVASVTGDESLAEVVRTAFGGTILKSAAANGDLCFAPDRGRNVTFVDARAWLGGHWQEPEPELATAVIAHRFFDAYGPATVDDFARWWGVPAAAGKRLLRPLIDDLVGVDVDGTAALVTPAGAAALAATKPVRGHVRLLPAFDTYVLAPRSHRGHSWPEGLHARISRPAGWITPVLVVEGKIAGVWANERQGGSVRFEVEPLTPLTRSIRAAAEAQARSYEALLDAPVEVSWVEQT